MKQHPGITADPKVMTGVPCIKGTRVTVANVVRQMAAGRSRDEICRDHPYLTADSIRAALEFAADLSASMPSDLFKRRRSPRPLNCVAVLNFKF